MYCPKCGTRLEEDDEICPNCGAKINKNASQQTDEPEEDFEEESDEDFEAESDEESEDESADESAGESAEESAGEPEQEASSAEEAATAHGGASAEEFAIEYGNESGGESDEKSAKEEKNPGEEQEQNKKRNTRISRPVFVVLFIVVSLISLYVLYTLWDDEGEEERAAGEETTGAEADEDVEEDEAEAAGEEDAEEEDVNGEDIVIEQENPADDYELEAFEESWDVIQQYGMDGSETYYRDFVESIYSYSDLSFTLESDTFQDLDDYYFIEAVFNKPVMVPVDLKPGDTYTVDIDELRGTVLTLTCTGSSNDEDYLEDASGKKYYCSGSGYDRMADLYEAGAGRVDAPFYEGVLRIRLDAVTGDAQTHGPYTHVTESDFEGEDPWFDIVAFDEKGYVKQLIVDD